MDSASTSDKSDASAATDDNHPDGWFSYRVIHRYLSQKSYPANFAKEDKHALRKRAQHFARQNVELYYVCVSSKCAYMSSGSYMYSNLNYRTLATVLMSYVEVLP